MTAAIPAAPPPIPDSSTPAASAAFSSPDSSASFKNMLQSGMSSNQPSNGSTVADGQQATTPSSNSAGAPVPNNGGNANSSEYSTAIHQYSSSGSSPSTPAAPTAPVGVPVPTKAAVPLPANLPTTAAMSILAAAIVPLHPAAAPVQASGPAGLPGIPQQAAALHVGTLPLPGASAQGAAVDSAAVTKNDSAGAAQVTTTTPLTVNSVVVSVPANKGATNPVVTGTSGTVPSELPLVGSQQQAVAAATDASPVTQTAMAPAPSAKSLKALQQMITGLPNSTEPTTPQNTNSGTTTALLNSVSRSLTLQAVPKQQVPTGASSTGSAAPVAPLTFSKPTPLALPIGIAPSATGTVPAQQVAAVVDSSTVHQNSVGTTDTVLSGGSLPTGIAGAAAVKPADQTSGSGSGTGGDSTQGQTPNQGRDTGSPLPQSATLGAVGQNNAGSSFSASGISTATGVSALQDQTAARIAVANQVASQIESQRLQNGNGRFVVNLHPAELGGVQVTVSQSRGVISARLVAETSQAQHALESGRHHLYQAFENRGIKVQSLQISLNSGGAGRQGASFQSQNQSNMARSAQSVRNSSISSQPLPEDHSAGIPISSIGSVEGSKAMLDYRA